MSRGHGRVRLECAAAALVLAIDDHARASGPHRTAALPPCSSTPTVRSRARTGRRTDREDSRGSVTAMKREETRTHLARRRVYILHRCLSSWDYLLLALRVFWSKRRVFMLVSFFFLYTIITSLYFFFYWLSFFYLTKLKSTVVKKAGFAKKKE